MATKSVLKTIYIKESAPARALASVLEHAKGKASKDVCISRPHSELGRGEIQKIFGQNKSDNRSYWTAEAPRV